jgi:hypothetical protein
MKYNDCPICGPNCIGGAHRLAMIEDGVIKPIPKEQEKQEEVQAVFLTIGQVWKQVQPPKNSDPRPTLRREIVGMKTMNNDVYIIYKVWSTEEPTNFRITFCALEDFLEDAELIIVDLKSMN